MSKLIVFGAGEFAQVAAVYLENDSPHEVVAFTVDGCCLTQEALLGKPVVPFETLPQRFPPGDFDMFVAVGYNGLNHNRAEIYHRCKQAGYRLISYVCSRAVQWGHVEIGDNVFVFEGNVLQPFSSIGCNTVLWSGNHVGHHAQIGNHCFVTSHVVVSGGVRVGDHCFLGVNAAVGDHIQIADHCVIGAGAIVLKDTEPDGVYRPVAAQRAAVPASRLRPFSYDKRMAG